MDTVSKMPEIVPLAQRYDAAFSDRQVAARRMLATHSPIAAADFRAAQKQLDSVHADAQKLSGGNDTNYIFLSFVTHYLPIGIVGLIVGVIFTAAMSAISGEINSLATVSVIDVYKRYMAVERSDQHYLGASRMATVFWAIYAMAFASFASNFGALIEAVNYVGSLFYGGMLGVFVLAFFVRRCTANAAFIGVIAGEIAIFITAQFTGAYLWFNVIGCVVVVAVGTLLSARQPAKP
jgi:Na+/proline symporter